MRGDKYKRWTEAAISSAFRVYDYLCTYIVRQQEVRD